MQLKKIGEKPWHKKKRKDIINKSRINKCKTIIKLFLKHIKVGSLKTLINRQISMRDWSKKKKGEKINSIGNEKGNITTNAQMLKRYQIRG